MFFQGQHLLKQIRQAVRVVLLLIITFSPGGCAFRALVSVQMRAVREKALDRMSDIARKKGVKR